MLEFETPTVLGILLTLILSLAATQMMIKIAHQKDWLVHPKADRWHARPTALYGGVAIFSSFMLMSLFTIQRMGGGPRVEIAGLIAGGALLFCLGLRDDMKPLNPLVKLVGQFMSATPFMVAVGIVHPTPLAMMSMPLILLWMVALTNSFNLLDNMDGLSAGTASIVGLIVSAYSFMSGSILVGALSAVISSACVGFLYFNFRVKENAHIFMGDCGSMFLGYMLAGLSILAALQGAADGTGAAAFLLLVMALPIFDTSLVIVLRRREGRAISQGGKDHSSHRLVYAGFTEKQSVMILYAISLVAGGCALLLEKHHYPLVNGVAVVAAAAGLARLGIFLSAHSGFTHAVTASQNSTASLSIPASAPTANRPHDSPLNPVAR